MTAGKKFRKAASKGGKRRPLLKATAVGLLGFACYSTYVPDGVKDSIGDKFCDVTGFGQGTPSKNFDFTFESDTKPSILGAQASGVFQSDLNLMDEWFAVLGRHQQLLGNPDNRATFNKWLSALNDYKGKSIAEKCAAVDGLIDERIAYVLDPDNYGKAEYFASPMETMQRGRGDCDDYAILKYFALRYLDVPAERMYVVAVGSTGGDIDHATLLVDTREPGMLRGSWEWVAQKFGQEKATRFQILDNDYTPAGQLIQEKDSPYKPYIAMNEKGIWAVSPENKLSW